jgi:hypothetical protein
MGREWKNEDDIKAELRTLTEELRTLRHELRNMVTPKKTSPSRAFLHRHSWPSAPPRTEEPPRRPTPEPRAKKTP